MTITGYPLVFDSPSVLLGDFIEVVRPAALRRTLTGSADIVALVNHNADMPLARRSANSLISASDVTGLRVDIRAADDVTYAANAARAIGRGDARVDRPVSRRFPTSGLGAMGCRFASCLTSPCAY